MKRILGVLLLAATLAACSSGVKLDDVPVTDATGKAVGALPAASAPAAPASVGDRSVATVTPDDGVLNKAGPANVAKVIYFDYDSFVIKPEFQGAVEAHAKFLNANRARRMAVDGHTDERGGREYNLALGQKRSEAVRRALGLLGVADNQVEAVSFGEEKPAAAGATEDAWAKNRRAEINYR